jgi:heterodisulfide reductase subunit B2
MKLSFYPGCSLEGMANDYALSVTAVFQALGIDLIEIDDWSCCGATAAHSLSETMSVALPARNLALAEKIGLDIVAPCANCFNRLRYSQQMVKKRIVDIPWDLTGDIRIHDITRFLAEPEMLRQVRERVLRPLKGLRVVCYYGCQMVRHPSITGFTDYENPRTLDLLVSAAGAEAIDWSYKSTCCGASIGIGRKDIQETLTRRILEKARQAGAEALVVSCPLCQSNLDVLQKDMKAGSLPVFYFTELLRLAFEETPEARWFKQHLTNPVGLLQAKGLV